MVAIALVMGGCVQRRAPRIAFKQVHGATCLQPVVNRRNAELSDYRAAAIAWLVGHYPGFSAPRWQTVLHLTDQEKASVLRETAYVSTGDGEIEVCFDYHLRPGT